MFQNVHIKDEPEDPRENLEVVMEDEDEPVGPFPKDFVWI